MFTANILHCLSHQNDDCLIVVDVCGLGAGIADRLIEMGDNVLAIDNAEKAGQPDKYYNRRSEVWCGAAEAFAGNDVQLTNTEPRLRGQLASPTYHFREGRILIESKADIKKRLGNSPDRADAYVNGLYALQFVEGELVGGKDAYSENEEDDNWDNKFSAMGM
jgi:hypothetical protein